MNKQKLIAEIRQNFMLKRIHAQEECEEFISSLRKDPEFDNLYSNLTQKNITYLRKRLYEDCENLKQEIDDLTKKIDGYMIKNNLDKSLLYPKFDCKICNDTGVNDGKICKCLQKELNRKISITTSSQNVFKSFENSNDEILTEEDKKVYTLIKSWCEKFPQVTKINVNIMGGSGSGKTFLMECVANELMKKSVAVTYKTAFEFNELARMYHIGKSYDFSDLMNAEVLFIDDLGTEPVLKNITKEYLYNLINTRQNKNLPTFITTNLSLENILSRYDERIFSRLANKNLTLNLCLSSKDKRI